MPTFEEKRLEAKRAQARLLQSRISNENPILSGLKSAGRAVDDTVRSLASGATLGFADEIAAGANAVVTGQPLEETLAAERARDAAIPTEQRVVGEIGGALATGALTAPLALAKGGSLLANLGRSAALGATEGGIAGAGFSEGGLQERGEGALRGAALGGALGAAVPAAVSGAARVAGGARNLARGGGRFRTRAAAQLEDAIARDQQTPQELAARIKRLGPDAVIADVGGENVKGLARGAASVPGTAKRAANVLQSRLLEQGRRIKQSVSETLSSANFNQTVSDIVTRRRAKAAPIYEQVLKAGDLAPPGARGDKLRTFIADAKPVQRAIKKAKGLPEFTNLPDTDIRVLDQAYKEIGGAANKARRAGNGTQSANLNKLRVQLKKRITNRVPEYEDALDVFSSESRILDGVKEGRGFILEDAEITAKELADMPASEREGFIIGASRALKDIIDRAPDASNAVRRIFGTRLIRDKIRALFPNAKEFRVFQRTMLQEAKFAQTRNAVLEGSRTAPLQQEIANLGVIPRAAAELGADVATGGASGVVSGAARGLRDALSGPSEQTLRELGDLLFTQGAPQNQDILTEIFKRRLQRQAVPLLGGELGAAAAIEGGSIVGPSSRP